MKLVAFSWGFWGWGTSTPQLIGAVDTVERRRGFNPPIFVDIRFRRSGRAPGFQGNEFEALLGWRRYRWMKSLGNSSIGKRRKMKIAFEPAVAQLLDLVLDAHARSSHVIFFCACESPAATNTCHRHLVTKLLLREAKTRQIDLQVQEWPGGQPRARPLKLRISPDDFVSVARGAKSIPLNTSRIRPELAGLAWGTPMQLRAGSKRLVAAVGPAAYRRGRWVVPLFTDAEAGVSPSGRLPEIMRAASRLRRRYGLDRR